MSAKACDSRAILLSKMGPNRDPKRPLGGSWARLGRLFGGSGVPLGLSWEPLGPPEAPKSSPRRPKKRLLLVLGTKMELKSIPNRGQIGAKSIQTLLYFQEGPERSRRVLHTSSDLDIRGKSSDIKAQSSSRISRNLSWNLEGES